MINFFWNVGVVDIYAKRDMLNGRWNHPSIDIISSFMQGLSFIVCLIATFVTKTLLYRSTLRMIDDAFHEHFTMQSEAMLRKNNDKVGICCELQALQIFNEQFNSP